MNTITVVMMFGEGDPIADSVWTDAAKAKAYVDSSNERIRKGNEGVAMGWGNKTYFEVVENVPVDNGQFGLGDAV